MEELIILKGPAVVGKSSLMNLTEFYCQNNSVVPDRSPTPVTAYTFIESDGKPALEQIRDALGKMEPWCCNKCATVLPPYGLSSHSYGGHT
mmetsp:Transcript_24158/g.39992  ORF Transcript_24158/g.39992 Transcript_24158/m.39992 type:complete len:91 (-) Transcript_24158:7-279(-)